MSTRRRLLCRSASIATRQRVYSIPDGLEIDEVDHFDVRRWRVLYEDVILVTYHHYRGAVTLSIILALLLMVGFITWTIGLSEPLAAGYTGVILVAPLAILFVVRLVLGIDEINVYSQRSQARLRFPWRKRRAHAVFGDITRAVRLRQRVASHAAAPAPAPETG